MLQTIRHFLSLIRFSHTLFALPFALLAALMAWRMQAIDQSLKGDEVRVTGTTTSFEIPWLDTSVAIHDTYVQLPFVIRWQELIVILLCMVFARSAAMAFNRLVDRKLDALNPRMAGRHIPAGMLSDGQVRWFAVACSAGFVASTLLFLPNRLRLYLAVPVLACLCG